MVIKKVSSIEEAKECDKLLSLLIQDEKKYNENIKEDYKLDNWYPNLIGKGNNQLFIAVCNNEIVGYVYVKIITSSDSPEIYTEASISGTYVKENFRRQGIATKLINEAKKWCVNKGVSYLKLNVLEGNSTALNLYKKLGFNDFSRILRVKL